MDILVEQLNQYLESQIKDPLICKHVSYVKCLMVKPCNIIASGTMKNIFEERMSKKKLVYIRHAESEINRYNSSTYARLVENTYPNELEFYDPEITQLGLQQCKTLKQVLDQQNMLGDADLVFVSPLTRTIQTFNQISGSSKFQNIKKVHITQLIRERSHKMAGMCGRKKSNLLESSQTQGHPFAYDLTYLNKEKWWRRYIDETEMGPNQIEHLDLETKEDLKARVSLLLYYCCIRNEKIIFWISHGVIYDCFDDFPILSQARNAEYHIIMESQYMKLAQQYF